MNRHYRLAAQIKDLSPGGKADHMPDSNFSQSALDKGQKIEMEHTDDSNLAREIAKDHLTEKSDYYDLLERYVEPKSD